MRALKSLCSPTTKPKTKLQNALVLLSKVEHVPDYLRRLAPSASQRLCHQIQTAPAMAARLPAPRRRLVAHQHRSHGQPHLGSLGGERLEIPFGHLDSVRACDSYLADIFLCAQIFSAEAEPLHSSPEPVRRFI